MQSNSDSREVTDLPGRRFCWASGMSVKPTWWHAPWLLEAAHLGSGSGSMHRVDDRRAVVCLCSLLHRLHVADRARQPVLTIGGKAWPTIDNANMIWIKAVWDPDYYDEQFIERIWNGKPPEPEPPHKCWTKMLNDNVGMRVSQ